LNCIGGVDVFNPSFLYAKKGPKMKKTLLLTAALTVLTVTTAVAATIVTETPTSNTTVQKNADGSTTTTTTNYYVSYDANHNGILDSQEFYKYAWTAWDANHDGYLSPDEWKLATVRWYGPKATTYQTYTYWDKNGDGRIDPTEFDTTSAATNLYQAWNPSGVAINDDTFAAQSFRMYDTNGDGVLSLDEYRNAL